MEPPLGRAFDPHRRHAAGFRAAGQRHMGEASGAPDPRLLDQNLLGSADAGLEEAVPVESTRVHGTSCATASRSSGTSPYASASRGSPMLVCSSASSPLTSSGLSTGFSMMLGPGSASSRASTEPGRLRRANT